MQKRMGKKGELNIFEHSYETNVGAHVSNKIKLETYTINDIDVNIIVLRLKFASSRSSHICMQYTFKTS